jgi:hypothetical protein
MHANLTPFENEVPIFINPYSRADGESWVARAMLAVEASKIQWHPTASNDRTVLQAHRNRTESGLESQITVILQQPFPCYLKTQIEKVQCLRKRFRSIDLSQQIL